MLGSEQELQRKRAVSLYFCLGQRKHPEGCFLSWLLIFQICFLIIFFHSSSAGLSSIFYYDVGDDEEIIGFSSSDVVFKSFF